MRTVDARSGSIALAGAAAGCGLALALGHGPAEMLFLGGLLVVAALVVDAQLRARSLVRRRRREVAELASIGPGEVARAAVHDERERLSREIEASLGVALRTIGELTEHARLAADPRAALRSIQREAQHAGADLRRQLGLLRADEGAKTGPGRAIPLPGPGTRRYALASGGVAAAVLEGVGYPLLDGVPPEPVAVTLAVAAALAGGAATWIWITPWAGGLLIGIVYAVGWVLGTPVPGGFWFLAVVGSTLWRLVAQVRRWRERDVVVVALLFAAVAGSTWRTQPDNAALAAAVLLVVAAGSMTRQLLRTHERDANAAAQALRAELHRARDAAAEAERRAMARDLHDVATHAIGIVAVHAGSALVSWPGHPEQMRRSLDIIDECVIHALAELPPAGGPQPRWPEHAHGLLDRVRAAGTPLRAELADRVAPGLEPIAYRVIQELLTNVVRHAPGAAAKVRVVQEVRCLWIEVHDDGPGYSARPSPGFGLRGLSERVQLAGGRADWETLPGNGFHVRVSVPVPAADADLTGSAP